jgi:phenylpyruvate tautomerase PptA (4-oxalocrotonate tautomerase family)
MPICVLLTPEGIADAAKEKLMSELTRHIHAAYPNTVTEVFLQEFDRSLVMVDGAHRGVRYCTLVCPPGIGADAKKAMMQNLTAAIAEAYADDGHIWIVHQEHDPASAMLNGRMLSEKYGQAPAR